MRKNEIVEEMILTGHFDLPLNLDERQKADGKTRPLDIEMKISLIGKTDRVEIKCKVDNHIYSHRLRVMVNTDIPAQETIASLPFGYIRRPVLTELPENWQENFVEMPIDIEPYDSSVAVESDDYHLTAFAKGMKEYQFIGKSLYLTMFSSTSQLGKENLLYRPGRASGDTTRQGHVMVETPMAELLGTNEFEFALQVKEGQFDEFTAAKTWQDYTMEHVSYQTQTLNKFIYRLDNKIQKREKVPQSPPEFSLLRLGENVLFSSIGPSLYTNAVLLRVKNPTNQPVSLGEHDFSNFVNVEKVNYIEEMSPEQELIIPAYDTLTLKLTI